MERLGMTNTQENFYHPMINPNHRLAEHVLYKMTRQQWQDAVLT
jgi:RimJ/RimL family protein N-acetyltransferase